MSARPSPSSLAPFVMVAFGWQAVAQVWAAALVVMAIIFWFTTKDDPDLVERRRTGDQAEEHLAAARAAEECPGLALLALLLLRLRRLRGAVAVAAAIPDRRLRRRHQAAGMLAAAFSIPASLFRAYGGICRTLRRAAVMYWTFLVSVVCTFMLVLSADRLCRPRRPTARSPFHAEMGLIAFRHGGLRARLLHERWARRRSTSTSRSTIPAMSVRSAVWSA
jgi:NNP family nitrate/nitrite transporter-like MFS transporter